MSFMEKPLAVLKMGQRQHESVLASLAGEVREIMKAHDWTCHKCGVRVEGYMQVDHTKGHGNADPKHLKPICPFCHDQDHLLWAAARNRVVAVLAPDLTNEMISRLSWNILSLSNHDDHAGVVSAVDNVRTSLRQRRMDFQQKYGADQLDAFIEAIYRFLAPDDEASPKEVADKNNIMKMITNEVRFVPALILEKNIEDPSRTVSVWDIGGFSAPQRSPAAAIGRVKDPDLLISATTALMKEAT